ncbi:UNVERIFIED_CONTAM: Helicase-like transcription factor CHR28 [Sesamum angustifolium]|uniref:Helicase-like transcription factor CHR28 n=1 Tax=Sesamum angustifolium TaxID=2727405 RepID=A0AAW2PES8_9LAMI
MMTAKVDDGSSAIMDELFSADDECNDVLIDLESFWRVMGDPAEASQATMLEESPFTNSLQVGLQNSEEVLSPRPGYGVLSPVQNSEASECRTGCSDGSSDSAGISVFVNGERLEPPSQLSLPEQSCSRRVADSPFGTPNHSDALSSYSVNNFINDVESSEICHLNSGEELLRCPGTYGHSENFYRRKSMEKTNRRNYVAHKEDASIIDGDRLSHDASHSSSCEINVADVPDTLSEHHAPYLLSPDNPPYIPHSSGFKSSACDGGWMVSILDDEMNHSDDFTSMMPYEDLVWDELGHRIANRGSGSSVCLDGQVRVTKYNDMHAMGYESMRLFPNTLSDVFSKIQDDVKVKKIESITSHEIVSRASEVIDDVISRNHCGVAGKLPAAEGRQWSLFNSLSSVSYKNHAKCVKDEKLDLKRPNLSPGMVGETPMKKSAIGARGWRPALQVSGQPGILPHRSIKTEVKCEKMETEGAKFNSYCLSNITYQGVQSNMLETINIEDDSDVCILEDMSAPARPSPTALNGKLVAASQFPTFRDSVGQLAVGHSRLKQMMNGSFFELQCRSVASIAGSFAAKSEATPPDGVLAVPLLKHQRIALSWMVNKETKSACCSGGILADDQVAFKGLGKTVSTIALILKERSPSSKAPKANKSETEMLNLDEDDGASETYHVKEPHQITGGNTCLKAKGRPAAGTLISIMEATVPIPLELARYDVVITTYAIVSMEVPKQPVVDETDDQRGKQGIDNELLETLSGPLAKVGWFRVVLDEAQSIKNHRTQVARACWGLRAKRRWCLSGTPIQNAIDDLYSYFRFLRHEPYAIFRTFCEQLKAPIHKSPQDGYKKLQAVLKTIMLRRTKGTFIDGEPIIKLPPKTIELKKVDFSEEERDFYCRLEADSRAQFAEYAAAGTVKQNYVNILLMLLRLRQACDHPLLVKGFSPNSQMTSSIEVAKKLPREKHIFLLNCLEASLAICGICSDPPEDAVVTVCGHVFCNQCICEHMIGDDTQCPTKNCKTHLTMSHVFSITTLRVAISNQQSVEKNPDHYDSEVAKVSDSCSLSCPHDSSKIKAALKLLLSLSKPHDPALRMSSIETMGECYSPEMLRSCDPGGKNGTSNMTLDSENSVKVVGEKAIVFSQWTRMLDLLEACLKNSSIQYRRLDGTMPVVARDRAVKDFNSLPQVSVMIMSLKAASLGLNMVAACHVILLDLWWNPTTEDQAIDRAHRIGQTRPVSVFRLTVKDTVEDRILALQQRKREMVASAFGEDGTGSRQTRLTVEDLKYLFRVD